LFKRITGNITGMLALDKIALAVSPRGVDSSKITISPVSRSTD